MRLSALILGCLALAGCGDAFADEAKFVALDAHGRHVATVILPDPLPQADFRFHIQERAGERGSTYRFEKTGSLGCHVSDAMPMICGLYGDEKQLPSQAYNGSAVVVEGLGEFLRYTLGERSFSDFRGRRLISFGWINADGVDALKYERTPR